MMVLQILQSNVSPTSPVAPRCLNSINSARSSRAPTGGRTAGRNYWGKISDPVVGLRTDTDRINDKIKKQRWTERDLARIEGRPEPGGDSQDGLPIR